ARSARRGAGLGGGRERAGTADPGTRPAAWRKHPPQPPETGAGAVFVHRFHVHVARSRPRLRAEHVGEKRFRGRIAVQDVALSAFLVIDHELDGDTRAAGPARIRRVAAGTGDVAAVTGEVAGIFGEISRGHGYRTQSGLLGSASQGRPRENAAATLALRGSRLRGPIFRISNRRQRRELINRGRYHIQLRPKRVL